MAIEVVLFDLGGVLVELREPPEMAAILRLPSPDGIRSAWESCPAVQAHETGQCITEEFGEGVVKHFNLDITAEQFLAGFRTWPFQLIDGAEALVGDLRPEIRKGCLSNTSAFHWQHQNDAKAVTALFENQFLSFELGMMKPDPRIFDEVSQRLGTEPEDIFFLDDNPKNVEAAIGAGFEAYCVQGPEMARMILEEYELVTK
ncbi:MAG: HAD family phosphatase [Proteobacteria bacterium]|nr:HAD family phosphatase [Pseudomonadota bacterium]